MGGSGGGASRGGKLEDVGAGGGFEVGEGCMKVGEGGGGDRNGDIFQTSVSFLCLGFALGDIYIGVDRKAAAVVESVGLVRDVGVPRREEGLEDIQADESAFSVDGADVLRDVGGEAFVDGVGRRRSHVGQEGSNDGTEGYLLEKGVRVGGRECRHRNRNGVIVGSEGYQTIPTFYMYSTFAHIFTYVSRLQNHTQPNITKHSITRKTLIIFTSHQNRSFIA